ncbi:MAG: DUF1501 domain-containing protein [Pirellulaceae bacterium]|nr:DUF1501 domain-containing protein [Pirellulaceae bacterium]
MTNRRTFLVASSCGIAGFRFGASNRLHADDHSAVAAQLQARSGQAKSGGQAKSVILFFLCGGASHIDTWDMKPNAPIEYRGPFSSIATSAPDIRLCEHLPLLSQQAHHLAVVRSVCGTVNTNDHHAGYYYNLTGHRADPTFLSLGNDRRPYADDWPYMGTVVASRRPMHPQLPNAITLPHKPSQAPYTRPGQFAARLGVEFDPLYVNGSTKEPLKFQAPALVLAGDVTTEQLRSRQQLLSKLDGARREFDHSSAEKIWKNHQSRTLDLLMSAKATEAFDVSSETPATRDRYGTGINAMSLLLARRLAEAEVPFITVFWKEDESLAKKCASEGAWDTHGNNFTCLKENLLPEFDRAFSALIEDLANRNLLDQTLLLVTSEMGRKPKIGDPRSGGAGGAGRDHWTHCQSVLMAGGGIRGGQVFGTTDRFGEYVADQPLTPADITKTVYHATGINDLKATDTQGRVYNLLEEGNAITQLF